MGWGSAARLDNPNRPNPMSLSRSQRRPLTLSLCSRSGGGAAVFSLPSLPSGLRPSLLVGRARRPRPARQSISCSPASPCSPVASAVCALLRSISCSDCSPPLRLAASPISCSAAHPARESCSVVLGVSDCSPLRPARHSSVVSGAPALKGPSQQHVPIC